MVRNLDEWYFSFNPPNPPTHEKFLIERERIRVRAKGLGLVEKKNFFFLGGGGGGVGGGLKEKYPSNNSSLKAVGAWRTYFVFIPNFQGDTSLLINSSFTDFPDTSLPTGEN